MESTLPSTSIEFDANGDVVHGSAAAIAGFVKQNGLTELIFHTHGFNNSRDGALRIAGDYFGAMKGVLTAHAPHKTGVGYCAVIWPSEALVVQFGQIAVRAETVGSRGLARVVNEVRRLAADSALKIHLSGHSLGARLSSYALLGLDAPVRSLFLIQGALSAWSFAFDVVEVNPVNSGVTFVGKLVGLKNDLRGALAAVRDRAEFIGATESRSDGDLWGYAAAAVGPGVVIDLLSNALGLPLSAQSIPKAEELLGIIAPPISTKAEAIPLGLVGLMEGKFQHLQTEVDAVDPGVRYTGLRDRFGSFNFNGRISGHNDFRRADVAWAHLTTAAIVS
ncbi:MAG: alpha/beta hydrolase [Polyangiaceae bacterium]|nr:alpha/beta hydrolase [Polyangiaceae bacterium]